MTALAEIWRKPRGFWVDALPAMVYLGLLFWLGLAPLDKLPGPQFRFVDKVWHFLAFAALAVLLARALWHFGRKLALATRDGALASAALGALLEVLQALTAFRSAEVADVIADGLGALAAFLVLRRLA